MQEQQLDSVFANLVGIQDQAVSMPGIVDYHASGAGNNRSRFYRAVSSLSLTKEGSRENCDRPRSWKTWCRRLGTYDRNTWPWRRTQGLVIGESIWTPNSTSSLQGDNRSGEHVQ